MATAVFFHAHPDDEAIATGGTMAKLASEGHRVVLVTATRGELGEIPPDLLEPGETLAEHREGELAAACDVLGVARYEFLGYRDSGMEGTASNEDPACFWQADVEEAAEHLAGILRSENADAISAYDERGVYGHPDHVQVHRVGMRAAELAGTSRVFMATVNRDHITDISHRAAELAASEELVAEMEGRREDLMNLGVAASRITTAVNVQDFLDLKRRAMSAHASQISETSFFLAPPPEIFAAVWGTEWYIRVGATPGEPFEGSLLSTAG